MTWLMAVLPKNKTAAPAAVFLNIAGVSGRRLLPALQRLKTLLQQLAAGGAVRQAGERSDAPRQDPEAIANRPDRGPGFVAVIVIVQVPVHDHRVPGEAALARGRRGELGQRDDEG